MSCAHSFGEWCPGCIDGLVQDYNRVRKELAALKAQAPPAPATSAPTVEQIKALRERHGATNQTWIYGFDEAIDAVLALYADTRQPQAEPGWQPIETAPKDTFVLVRAQAWARPAIGALRLWYRPSPPAWTWLDENGDELSPYEYEGPPTHWMPLPPAPRDGEQET
jgi:hypothetical protein